MMLFDLDSKPQYSTVEDVIRKIDQQLKHLGSLSLEAEISSFSIARSNHWYFDVKDPQGTTALKCCMFRNKHRLLDFTPKLGDRVRLKGSCNLYLQTTS